MIGLVGSTLGQWDEFLATDKFLFSVILFRRELALVAFGGVEMNPHSYSEMISASITMSERLMFSDVQ